MADLIDTTQMYLRTILELEEDGIVPMRARIAQQLGQSGPTVSQTVSRMERDGLVTVGTDRALVLTDEGRREATAVMRKHRLAERLLLDVIGLPLGLVHEEACRWEHVMSEQVERLVAGLVGDPTLSPYGNRVPGLDDVGAGGPLAPQTGEVPLSEIAEGLAAADRAQRGREVEIVRIGEPAQADLAFLDRVVAAGVIPGARCRITAPSPDALLVAAPDLEPFAMDLQRARHIYARTGPGA